MWCISTNTRAQPKKKKIKKYIPFCQVLPLNTITTLSWHKRQCLSYLWKNSKNIHFKVFLLLHILYLTLSFSLSIPFPNPSETSVSLSLHAQQRYRSSPLFCLGAQHLPHCSSSSVLPWCHIYRLPLIPPSHSLPLINPVTLLISFTLFFFFLLDLSLHLVPSLSLSLQSLSNPHLCSLSVLG